MRQAGGPPFIAKIPLLPSRFRHRQLGQYYASQKKKKPLATEPHIPDICDSDPCSLAGMFFFFLSLPSGIPLKKVSVSELGAKHPGRLPVPDL